MAEVRRSGTPPAEGEMVAASRGSTLRRAWVPERADPCCGCWFAALLKAGCPRIPTRRGVLVVHELMCESDRRGKWRWVEVDPLEADFRRALEEGE